MFRCFSVDLYKSASSDAFAEFRHNWTSEENPREMYSYHLQERCNLIRLSSISITLF